MSLAMLLFLGKPHHRFEAQSKSFRWFSFASIVIVAVAGSVGLATPTIMGCEKHPEWKNTPVFRCIPGKYIGIFHLACEQYQVPCQVPELIEFHSIHSVRFMDIGVHNSNSRFGQEKPRLQMACAWRIACGMLFVHYFVR